MEKETLSNKKWHYPGTKEDIFFEDDVKQFIKIILNKPDRITYIKWIKLNAGKELVE